MPYVHTFIYADNVQAVNVPLASDTSKTEQKILITGPLSILKPIYVPGTFSFSISCNILGFDHTTAHSMRLCFSKLDSSVILADTGSTEITLNVNADDADILPVNLRGLTFALDFKNVNIPETGMHKTDVFVDNELIGSFPIEVWRKPI